jgi:DNA-binding beta-propeller fold protein YncE
MSDSKECKIIDSIDVTKPSCIIQTSCGKFLIWIEGNSIFIYCFETEQKFRIAGSVDQLGYQDGTRDESRFNSPYGLTLSKDLKTLYVSDTWSRVIRVICVQTGMTTTFAGQVGKWDHIDGPKEKACFGFPRNLQLSPDENTLYVSDDSKLRTICIATGQVDTIHTFENNIYKFELCSGGKHVYICHWEQVLKYNLETGKSEIIFKGEDFVGCELSKDGQLLFIASYENKCIQVVNIVTNKVIDTIFVCIEPTKLTISTNGKQLFVCDYNNEMIKVFDISKYCTNFKTFLQSQFFKQSFLFRSLIKRFN